MLLGCEWSHARKRWAGNFGDFWKKQLVEIWTWARPVQLGTTGCAVRLLGQLVEIWLASSAEELTVGDVGTVSIVKIVCVSLSLSSCRKTKSQKN